MTESAREIHDRIRLDPVWFCRKVLRFDPWSRQRDVVESVRDHMRTAVRSCHGPGKTGIAGRTALWFLAAFPRSKVITTAPTFMQVREQLWREIATGYQASAGFFTGVLTDTKLELAPDWFAIGLSTDRPERFHGYHAEHLLLIVDEASGVDEAIFEAAEGFLTAASTRVLLIGNPTQLSGTFHAAFHRERAAYNTISISAFDTPAFTREEVSPGVLRRLVSREWVEARRRAWGEGSPLWQVKVLGEFPTTSDNNVMSLGEIEAAQRRKLKPGFETVVACDVARFGSDETVIAVRRGEHVRIAETYMGKDTMETAGRVLRVARELAAKSRERPVIRVDDVGVGGGVTDRLRETSEYKVVPFNGGSSPRDKRGYPNARSEGWFGLADMLPSLDLDEDEQLLADLVAPRYSIDSAGRRVLEAKEQTKRRLGRSPDRGDAVVMLFAGRRPLRLPTLDEDEDESPLARRRRRAGRSFMGIDEPAFPSMDSPL
jgi:hypothetical protein